MRRLRTADELIISYRRMSWRELMNVHNLCVEYKDTPYEFPRLQFAEMAKAVKIAVQERNAY